MKEIQDFADALAGEIGAALAAVGLDVPVWSGVMDADERRAHVRVRVESSEEVEPQGNFTYRLNGAVELAADAGEAAEELREWYGRVNDVVLAVLRGAWRGRMMDDAGAACTVLSLAVEPAELETDGELWQQAVKFRAYVQF